MKRRLRFSMLLMTATVLATGLAGSLAFGAEAQTNGTNAGIEAQVRAAFVDAPDMIAVAKCESGFRQFAAEGVVLRGGAGKGYLGIFQIGESLHTAPAAALGLDILTIEGNIAYARRLYDARGIAPWRECAPSSTSNTSSATTTTSTPVTVQPPSSLRENLVLGMRGSQVQVLQKILNGGGFVIATSGAGSPGNETLLFGALTRDAVRRFQCAKLSVCEGNETTTGYGRVGPKTRTALNALRK